MHPQGRPAYVQVSDGSNNEVLLDNVQYNTESLITQFDYGNDLQTTFSYDSMDGPLTIDIKNGETSLLSLDYTYNHIFIGNEMISHFK